MASSTCSPDPGQFEFQPQPNSQFRSDPVVYFYQESDSLLDSLCDFIGPALGGGHAAVVIASKVHSDGLQHRLTARGLDFHKASKQGRYVTLDASETLSRIMVDGMPDGGRFAEIIGGTIVRAKALLKGPRPEIAIFGEMVSLLWTEGKTQAAIRLEELWNELALKHSFSLR